MMSFLSAIGNAAARQAEKSLGRMARLVALYVVGGLMLLVALGFLTAALYTAIAGQLGVIPAQLIVAGIFLVLGLVLIVVAAMRERPEAEPRQGLAAMEMQEEFGIKGRPAGLATVAASFAFGLARGLTRRRR